MHEVLRCGSRSRCLCHDMDVAKLREVTAARKRRFAQELDCWEKKRPNGEKYGWELKAPYPEQEIREFEAQCGEGFELPADFRTYLTRISREVYGSHYPETVELFLEGSCPFAEGADDWLYNEECDDDYDKEGTMWIGVGGCEWNDHIVVRGTNLGTVWQSSSGGYRLLANTFAEYLQHKEWEDDRLRSS